MIHFKSYATSYRKWLCLDKSKNTLQLKRTKALVLYCSQQNELITNHSKHGIQILYWTICNLSQSSKSVRTVTDTVESAKVGRGTTTTRTRNQMVERVVESRRVKVKLVAHAHSPYLQQKLGRSSTWSRTTVQSTQANDSSLILRGNTPERFALIQYVFYSYSSSETYH